MIDEKVYEDGIIKAKKKRILRKRMIVLGISLLVILLVTVGIFLTNNYYKDMNTIKYENYNLYQYFSGIRYDYTGIITIEHEDEVTNIKSDGVDIDFDNTPIYYQEIDNEVLFPDNMEIIFPSIKNKAYKLNYFSKIMVDLTNDEESAFLVNKEKNIYLDKSFLYDGNDLYFFPYSTKVIIDGELYNLSPLSYINVEYNGSIEIYNKKIDKYTIIDNYKKDVIANFLDYQINLSTDMIMYNENDNRILIKNVNKLNLYEEDTIIK